MSRSVQTMTFMPLASVIDFTWSSPFTTYSGATMLRAAAEVASITLPPRRRRTIIPAIAGRMLATPCAWGRISVTVDLAITGMNRAMAVPARRLLQNQELMEARDICARGG